MVVSASMPRDRRARQLSSLVRSHQVDDLQASTLDHGTPSLALHDLDPRHFSKAENEQ
jgi:hypothetical protein